MYWWSVFLTLQSPIYKTRVLCSSALQSFSLLVWASLLVDVRNQHHWSQTCLLFHDHTRIWSISRSLIPELQSGNWGMEGGGPCLSPWLTILVRPPWPSLNLDIVYESLQGLQGLWLPQDSKTSFGIQAILRRFLPDFLSPIGRFWLTTPCDRCSSDGLALRTLGCLLLPQVQQGNNYFWLSIPVTHLSFRFQFPRERVHTQVTFWREYWDVYYLSMKHVVCHLFYLQVDRAHHSTNFQGRRSAVHQSHGCTGRPWAQWDDEERFIS